MRERAIIFHNEFDVLLIDSVVTIAYDNEESIHQNETFAVRRELIV